MKALLELADRVGGLLVSITLSGSHWKYGIQLPSCLIPVVPQPYIVHRIENKVILLLEIPPAA